MAENKNNRKIIDTNDTIMFFVINFVNHKVFEGYYI